MARAARLWIGLLFLFAFLSPLVGADDKPKAALSPEQRERYLKTFDHVWQTVRDKHWDPKLNGVDWPKVRDELRPRVEQAKTTDEARAVLSQMLERLKQSHFGIIPVETYRAMQKSSGNGKDDKKDDDDPERGSTGLDVRVVDEHVLVTKVDEDLPAAKLGVQPGWQVHKAGGQDLAPVLARLRKTYKDSTLLDIRLTRAVLSRLSGKVGDKVTIVFRNGADEEVTLALPVAEPKGKPTTFGHFPTLHVRLEARRLDGNLGYVALNAFFDPVHVMQEFEKAIRQQPRADGLVLDLRGNPGGIGGMALGIGGWFVQDASQKLGTMMTRQGTLHFVLHPRAEPFTGPLAILVDGCSASTSEILAGGLQDLKRARVFGTRTAGAALPSVIERLPSGDGFQFAIANYISVGGQVLEGRGVIPDVEVKPERKALLAGKDPALDAAVQWLRAQKKP